MKEPSSEQKDGAARQKTIPSASTMSGVAGLGDVEGDVEKGGEGATAYGSMEQIPSGGEEPEPSSGKPAGKLRFRDLVRRVQAKREGPSASNLMRASTVSGILGKMNKNAERVGNELTDSISIAGYLWHEEDDDDEEYFLSEESNEPDETSPLRLSQQQDQGRSTYAKSYTQRVRARRRVQLEKAISRNLHPLILLGNIYRSCTVTIGIPLLILAWIVFTYLDNFTLDFIPGGASLSWWFIFWARQMIILDLARVTQRVISDGSSFARRVGFTDLESFFIMFLISAKGWPFTVGAWGLWDMLLLHGNNDSIVNWLHWTGLGIFSSANPGGDILYSDFYSRVLISMLVAGVATSAKRVHYSLYFGRRHLVEFKPKLQKLIEEVVLVTEIAILAEEVGNTEGSQTAVDQPKEAYKAQVSDVRHSLLADVAFSTTPHIDDDDSEVEAEQSETTPADIPHFSMCSTEVPIRNLLDPWEEPVNKLESSKPPSIADIISFRRALTVMKDKFPFGSSFGPAGNRDECIMSAQDVYLNLIKLTPGEESLSYDIFGLLAVDADGNEDTKRKRTIRRLFQPGATNEITMLNFISCCDNVYKHLRYLYASIANSSVIDKVLEDIINVIFFFILIMVLLGILKINAWSILLPFTSLIVSFGFALGPSLSKYVEGITFFLVRRPYELGDRIMIIGADNLNNPTAMSSWLVEDITVFATVLRHAITNEVATVHNWSIANARIVNCNRSPNAHVRLDVKLHMSVLAEDTRASFRKALEGFVRRNPRKWVTLRTFRCDAINTDYEFVNFTIIFRHRNSWQNNGRLMLDRAEVQEFVYQTAKLHGVYFEIPPVRGVVYDGGTLECGYVNEYKRDLVGKSNL